MYIEGFKEGEPYTSLTRCIAINLISQGFKLNRAVHSVYSIQEQNNHQSLTDLLEIHFLNLSAVKGSEIRQTITTKKQEKLLNWLRFTRTSAFENSGTGYKAQSKIKRRRTCCTSSIYFCAATP
ncbi:MAG: PD-(D/E)XK nuclease family transposase [Treponema sp.]|uniref:PD-(D/E)XK nuclease family transposase n=1 Tax=Treponema sp. TaxID=166 RepID=UPI003FA31301